MHKGKKINESKINRQKKVIKISTQMIEKSRSQY